MAIVSSGRGPGRLVIIAMAGWMLLTGCGSTVAQQTAGSPGGLSGTVPQGAAGAIGGPAANGLSTTSANGGGQLATSANGGGTSGANGGGATSSGGPGSTSVPTGLGNPQVTAKTISIGIGYVTNGDTANAAIGATGIGQGDPLGEAKAVVSYINAHGGVAGRKVTPVYHPYDATSTATTSSQDQAACADYTQDLTSLDGQRDLVEGPDPADGHGYF